MHVVAKSQYIRIEAASNREYIYEHAFIYPTFLLHSGE
jgi:hypothetical protein